MMVDLTPAEAGICLLAIVKAEFAAGWEGTPRPWGAAYLRDLFRRREIAHRRTLL